MLDFNFSEKGLGPSFSSAFCAQVFNKKKDRFSCYILLTDQISLADCLAVASKNLKLILSF